MNKKCVLCLQSGHNENLCGYKTWILSMPLDNFKYSLDYKKNINEWKNLQKNDFIINYI